MNYSDLDKDNIKLSLKEEDDDYFMEIILNTKCLKNAFKNYFKQEALQNTGLTNREIQILEYLAKGYNNNEIAKTIFVSVHTVKAIRKNIIKI